MQANNILVHKSELKSSTVNISGYKHSATVIIAASIILPKISINLTNVPNIDDVKYMAIIINALGGEAFYKDNTLSINSENLQNFMIPQEYSKHIHGALYFLPVILGRLKQVKLGNCGGCQIGENSVIGKRPIKHMLSTLEKFGGHFEFKDEYIIGKAESFHACTIDIMDYSDRKDILTGPLVSGATKTAILAAACTKYGTTKIINPYPKPDVTELLKFLSHIGYNVKYESNQIEISSPATYIPNKIYEFKLISDISQIMTYITLSVYHNLSLILSNITIDSVREGLKTEFRYLKDMGINLLFKNDTIEICKKPTLSKLDIEVTSIGIYSDHQPLFAIMLLEAENNSTIKELVWKLRFSYATQLKKLGLLLEVDENQLMIYPSSPTISNQVLYAEDLRAAAVLLIVALKAPGKTTVQNIGHLKRGYDNFVETLIALGAKIETLP